LRTAFLEGLNKSPGSYQSRSKDAQLAEYLEEVGTDKRG
jgi:hypothetical protein